MSKLETVKGLVYVLSGLLEIAVPIALGFYLRRRLNVSWRWFFLGALFFIASLIRLPLNQYVSLAILTRGVGGSHMWLLLSAFPSLTAGVFEEAARYVAYRFVMKEHSMSNGLMYGAGHGGIESILVVGVNVTILGALLLLKPSLLQPQIVDAVQMSPAYMPLIGLYERIMAMTIQIGLSVMVLESFRRSNMRYLLLAMILHFALDFIALSTLKYGVLYPELAATGFALGIGYWCYEIVRAEGLTG